MDRTAAHSRIAPIVMVVLIVAILAALLPRMGEANLVMALAKHQPRTGEQHIGMSEKTELNLCLNDSGAEYTLTNDFGWRALMCWLPVASRFGVKFIDHKGDEIIKPWFSGKGSPLEQVLDLLTKWGFE